MLKTLPKNSAAYKLVAGGKYGWISHLTCRTVHNTGHANSLNRPSSRISPDTAHYEFWAGYVYSRSLPSDPSVGAEWNVPRLVSHSGTSDNVSAVWVGIGGTTGELLQIGTEQNAVCTEAACAGNTWYGQYYPWYEWVPGAYQQGISDLPISPGDEFTATVEYTGGQAIFTGCSSSIDSCVEIKESLPAPGAEYAWLVERTQGTTDDLADYNYVDVLDAGWGGAGVSGDMNAAQDKYYIEPANHNQIGFSSCSETSSTSFTCSYSTSDS